MIRRIQTAGATVVLLAPSAFAAATAGSKVAGPDAPKFGAATPHRLYDKEVLEPNGRWLLGLRNKDQMVIDIHVRDEEG